MKNELSNQKLPILFHSTESVHYLERFCYKPRLNWNLIETITTKTFVNLFNSQHRQLGVGFID